MQLRLLALSLTRCDVCWRPPSRSDPAVHNSQAMAVIQMINKSEFDGAIGKFDDEDIQVMETFATFVASKLEGSALIAEQLRANTSEAGKAFDLETASARSSLKALGGHARGGGGGGWRLRGLGGRRVGSPRSGAASGEGVVGNFRPEVGAQGSDWRK